MTEEHQLDVILFGDNADRHRLETRAPIIKTSLERTGSMRVDVTTDKTLFTDYVDKADKPFAELPGYDVLVLYHPSLRTLWTWNANQLSYLESFVEAGGGLLALHSTLAMLEDDPHHQRLANLVGGTIIDHGPLVEDVSVEITDAEHPITTDLHPFSIRDEPYNLRTNDDIRVLAEIAHDSIGCSPALWTKSVGDGRICYYSNGHAPETMADPNFQQVLANAIRWVGTK